MNFLRKIFKRKRFKCEFCREREKSKYEECFEFYVKREGSKIIAFSKKHNMKNLDAEKKFVEEMIKKFPNAKWDKKICKHPNYIIYID